MKKRGSPGKCKYLLLGSECRLVEVELAGVGMEVLDLERSGYSPLSFPPVFTPHRYLCTTDEQCSCAFEWDGGKASDFSKVLRKRYARLLQDYLHSSLEHSPFVDLYCFTFSRRWASPVIKEVRIRDVFPRRTFATEVGKYYRILK
ncbi:MAG TPA: hypothetical protein VJU16_06055 [Planctomycetota bacterium]|nr:hypothetical protein [Planctomycetota bacterium]